MRFKSDARRQAIIDAAIEIFRDVGYERASMATIAARVGGSKTTLYSYFKSKEELFAAAMINAMEDQGEELLALLDASEPDVAQVLHRFGEAYVHLITSPDALAITRTAVAEGSNSKLGAALYKLGPQRGLELMAEYLAELIGKGVIRPVDPHIAALHLKGLLDSAFVEPLLYGAKPELDVKEAVEAATGAFLQAYAVNDVPL